MSGTFVIIRVHSGRFLNYRVLIEEWLQIVYLWEELACQRDQPSFH